MTLFLSRLFPNIRSRQVRIEMANIYELHRTMMRAFPSPEQGGPGRVLFRLEEPSDNARFHILVQSETRPRWDFLDEIPGYLDLSDGPGVECKPIAFCLVPGQMLRFRLRANPTVKRDGKRHGLLKEEDQIKWLKRKGSESGFTPVSFQVLRGGSRLQGRTIREENKEVTFFSVTFEGVLQVTDPPTFVEKALASGIGSGKGFGFGLLSIAPYREEA